MSESRKNAGVNGHFLSKRPRIGDRCVEANPKTAKRNGIKKGKPHAPGRGEERGPDDTCDQPRGFGGVQGGPEVRDRVRLGRAAAPYENTSGPAVNWFCGEIRAEAAAEKVGEGTTDTWVS